MSTVRAGLGERTGENTGECDIRILGADRGCEQRFLSKLFFQFFPLIVSAIG
jgi:hypothetical protein